MLTVNFVSLLAGIVAQVVLENIYKSFSRRKSESATFSNTHRNESVNVLRRVNLTVEDGEFIVLVGPSGCGKSTILRLIAGLEDITGGNIWVGKRNVNYLPPSQRNIEMVFQNYALYPHMRVYENIAFGLRLQARRREGGREEGEGRGGEEKGEGRRKRRRGREKEGGKKKREMVSIKGRALAQQEKGNIKSGGAAATRNGQQKKRGRCSNEKWEV